MITVLLVDDHELVRIGIETLLSTIADVRVVGVASCGEQALAMMDSLVPNVVLMDINMPGMGGAEACRRIVAQYPQTKIIALSAYNESLVPTHLLKLGAAGFISKSSPVEEMVRAIHTVMLGKRYLCADVATTLALETLEEPEQTPFAKLSKRETEVVNLILQGKSIQEMAHLLDLSDKTVNTYRYRLYDKLQVKNDVELTHLATQFNHLAEDLLHKLKLKT
jgi:two-component system invasion response regulator UvrY